MDAAASQATRSDRIESTDRLRYPCCSVLPIGTTARPSRCSHSSTCIQFMSAIFMALYVVSGFSRTVISCVRLFAGVAHPPDRLRRIVGDQERAVLRNGHAYGAAPH